MASWGERKQGCKPLSEFEEVVNLFQQCQDAIKGGLPEPSAVIFVKQGFRPGALILFSLIFLAVGSLVGFWYRGLNSGGGGDVIHTIKEKMVSPAQEVAKPAPSEAPPKKEPLVPPVRVESRAVVIAPARVEAVLQKSVVPQKSPEPMSPAKRLLLQLEGKLSK